MTDWNSLTLFGTLSLNSSRLPPGPPQIRLPAALVSVRQRRRMRRRLCDQESKQGPTSRTEEQRRSCRRTGAATLGGKRRRAGKRREESEWPDGRCGGSCVSSTGRLFMERRRREPGGRTR